MSEKSVKSKSNRIFIQVSLSKDEKEKIAEALGMNMDDVFPGEPLDTVNSSINLNNSVPNKETWE